MDALYIKGLQHLVVVLLDLNFQTTNEFVPAMRGKHRLSSGGTRGNKIDVYDVYGGIMQHKT